MFDLKGKVALVTGGAQGIGLAYVKELLRNDLKGVALVDLNVAQGQEALNEVTQLFGKDRAIFVKADVTNRAQFEEAFETTIKTFKQLDVVINNAGIVEEINWEKNIAVNLTAVITGSMLATEKYFPKYKSGSEGVILNISSIKGLQPYEETPAYDAAKFGVVGFTRAMGGDLHYKTTNVRVVAICPGLTETNITKATEKQIAEPYLSSYLSYVKDRPNQKPEDVAKHALEVIKSAHTGSIWTVINKNCVKAEFPKYCD